MNGRMHPAYYEGLKPKGSAQHTADIKEVDILVVGLVNDIQRYLDIANNDTITDEQKIVLLRQYNESL